MYFSRRADLRVTIPGNNGRNNKRKGNSYYNEGNGNERSSFDNTRIKVEDEGQNDRFHYNNDNGGDWSRRFNGERNNFHGSSNNFSNSESGQNDNNWTRRQQFKDNGNNSINNNNRPFSNQIGDHNRPDMRQNQQIGPSNFNNRPNMGYSGVATFDDNFRRPNHSDPHQLNRNFNNINNNNRSDHLNSPNIHPSNRSFNNNNSFNDNICNDSPNHPNRMNQNRNFNSDNCNNFDPQNRIRHPSRNFNDNCNGFESSNMMHNQSNRNSTNSNNDMFFDSSNNNSLNRNFIGNNNNNFDPRSNNGNNSNSFDPRTNNGNFNCGPGSSNNQVQNGLYSNNGNFGNGGGSNCVPFNNRSNDDYNFQNRFESFDGSRPIQNPMNFHRSGDHDVQLVYDYNHSRRAEKLVEVKQEPKVSVRDPRMEKQFHCSSSPHPIEPNPNIQKDPRTAIVRPQDRSTISRPITPSPSAMVKIPAEQALQQCSKWNPIRDLNVEREKYEKAKMCKQGRNSTESEEERLPEKEKQKSVQVIAPVRGSRFHKPDKTAKMPSQFKPDTRPTNTTKVTDKIVIEKQNVPIITTPANFTHFKIPKVKRNSDASSSSEVEEDKCPLKAKSTKTTEKSTKLAMIQEEQETKHDEVATEKEGKDEEEEEDNNEIELEKEDMSEEEQSENNDEEEEEKEPVRKRITRSSLPKDKNAFLKDNKPQEDSPVKPVVKEQVTRTLRSKQPITKAISKTPSKKRIPPKKPSITEDSSDEDNIDSIVISNSKPTVNKTKSPLKNKQSSKKPTESAKNKNILSANILNDPSISPKVIITKIPAKEQNKKDSTTNVTKNTVKSNKSTESLEAPKKNDVETEKSDPVSEKQKLLELMKSVLDGDKLKQIKDILFDSETNKVTKPIEETEKIIETNRTEKIVETNRNENSNHEIETSSENNLENPIKNNKTNKPVQAAKESDVTFENKQNKEGESMNNKENKINNDKEPKVVDILKSRRKKNELEKLHEDIRNMFCSDQIVEAYKTRVTATTKCYSELSPKKKTPPRRKSMCGVPKTIPNRRMSMGNISPPPIEEDSDERSDKDDSLEIPKKKMPPRRKSLCVLPKRIPNRRMSMGNINPPPVEEDSDDRSDKDDSPPIHKKKMPPRRKSLCVLPKSIPARRMSMGNIRPPVIEDEDDDDDNDVDGIKNDDPYYDASAKNCRLCTKSGSNMVDHYIKSHPSFEIYCSRLNFSIAQKLKSGTYINEEVNPNFEVFGCIFCDNKLPVTTYYDIYSHIVSHTGEYYYKCLECDFRDVAFNEAHSKQHKFEIFPFPELEKNCIKAYMCTKCNFIQLHKKNVNMHVLSQHRDDASVPSIVDITMVNFNGLQIKHLDFDDLDNRFKEMPIIVGLAEQTTSINENFENYMATPVVEEEPFDDNFTSMRNFEKELEPLLNKKEELTKKSKRLPEDEFKIVIENISYDFIGKQFIYKSETVCYSSEDEDSFADYLQKLDLNNTQWSGFCLECDDRNIFFDQQSVLMEFYHLKYAHWYKFTTKAVIDKEMENSSPMNVLKPWTNCKLNKTSENCKKMLSLPTIISTFKCMGSGCSYSSQDLTKMAEHIDNHEADEFSEESDEIECSYCPNTFSNPANLMTHILAEHNRSQCYCPYCFYRSSPGNVYEHQQIYHPDRSPIILDGTYDGLYTIKAFDGKKIFSLMESNVKPINCKDCDENYYPLDVFVKHLQDHHESVYYCRECDAKVPVTNFFSHLQTHNKGSFDCIYCDYGAMDAKTIKKHVLDEHPNESSYICVRYLREVGVNHSNIESMSVFPIVHDNVFDPSIIKTVPKEVFVELVDSEEKCGGLKISLVQGGVSLQDDCAEKTEINDIISGLPEKYFFDEDISCKFCSYKTKIKVNFVRHIQQHKSGRDLSPTDPINKIVSQPDENPVVEEPKQKESVVKPVVKRRRISIADFQRERAVVTLEDFRKAPKYIPVASRLVCGAPDCQYTAIDEKIFKIHLEMLHSNEDSFKCPHCDFEILEGPLNLDKIFEHYNLHGETVFKCGQCTFIAPTTHLIGKHVMRKHSLSILEGDVLKVREGNSEFIEPATPEKNEDKQPTSPKKKRRGSVYVEPTSYECQSCDYKVGSFDIMKDHVRDKHNFKSQYECGICHAEVMSLPGLKRHNNYKHANQTMSFISHFIGSTDPDVESEATYWKRDSSKTKTIRGIELDDEEAELDQQNEDEENVEEEEESLDSPAQIAELFLKSYNIKHSNNSIIYNCELCADYRVDSLGDIQTHYQNNHPIQTFNPKLPSFLTFSCYFCEFKNTSPNLLNQHFTIYHDNLPCLYRIEKVLKCVYCKYTSSVDSIHKHSMTAHPKKKVAMSSIECATGCGLCKYVAEYQSDLVDHFYKTHSLEIVNPPIEYTPQLLRRLVNIKVNKVYKCTECHEILNGYQYRFHEHSTKCVPIEMPCQYLCKICPALMPELSVATKHMETHKQDPIDCEKCNKEFRGFDVILIHLTEQHRRYKEYKNEIVSQYTLEMILPNGLVVPKTDTTHLCLTLDNDMKRKSNSNCKEGSSKKKK